MDAGLGRHSESREGCRVLFSIFCLEDRVSLNWKPEALARLAGQ